MRKRSESDGPGSSDRAEIAMEPGPTIMTIMLMLMLTSMSMYTPTEPDILTRVAPTMRLARTC